MLLQIDFSNFQDSFISFRDSLGEILVTVISLVVLLFRKPHPANLLVVSDLTSARSFKVKLWRLGIKVPVSRLLLLLEVCNVESNFRKPLAANLTSTLLLSSLPFAVHTFVCLATDAKIV